MISTEELVRLMVSPLEEACDRMQEKLRDGDGDNPRPFILHRNQWNQLAKAYSQLMTMIARELSKIIEPLVICLRDLLFRAVKDAERSLEECVAPHVQGYFTLSMGTNNSGSTAGGSPRTIRRTDSGYDYVWKGPRLEEQKTRKDLRRWMAEDALSHILDCEVPHAHMDHLRTISLVVKGFLPIDVTGLMKCFATGIESVHFREEIYAKDDREARAFLRHEEMVKIDISQLLLHRLADAMNEHDDKITDDKETSDDERKDKLDRAAAAVKRLAVDPAEFHKWDDRTGFLGEGASGKVKLRKWISEDRPVAVKKGNIKPKEIRIQARVRHPNLLPLLCCTSESQRTDQNSTFLVMERMDSNIDDILRNEHCHVLVAGEMMLQIAKGMEYLHGHDIIHRDLKPANILVSGYDFTSSDDRRLRVRVADFGESKDDFQTFNPSNNNTYKVGTGLYRAPEVMNESEESEAGYSRMADVYSFAMVCYRILSGNELPPKIHKEKLSPEFDFSCLGAFKGMVDECWHHDPSKRPDFAVITEFLRFTKVCVLFSLVSGTQDRFPLERVDLFPDFCDKRSDVDEMLRSVYPGHYPLHKPYICGQDWKERISRLMPTPDVWWSISLELKSSKQTR